MEAIKTIRKKLNSLLLIISIVIAGFVTINTKNGLVAWQAGAKPAGGNILYVGGSGPNNYTKIQDAINDASNGYTIFVYNGIYYENVIIDKSISLIGENKYNTIIDAGYRGDVVKIMKDSVKISGFTIKNSYPKFKLCHH